MADGRSRARTVRQRRGPVCGGPTPRDRRRCGRGRDRRRTGGRNGQLRGNRSHPWEDGDDPDRIGLRRYPHPPGRRRRRPWRHARGGSAGGDRGRERRSGVAAAIRPSRDPACSGSPRLRRSAAVLAPAAGAACPGARRRTRPATRGRAASRTARACELRPARGRRRAARGARAVRCALARGGRSGRRARSRRAGRHRRTARNGSPIAATAARGDDTADTPRAGRPRSGARLVRRGQGGGSHDWAWRLGFCRGRASRTLVARAPRHGRSTAGNLGSTSSRGRERTARGSGYGRACAQRSPLPQPGRLGRSCREGQRASRTAHEPRCRPARCPGRSRCVPRTARARRCAMGSQGNRWSPRGAPPGARRRGVRSRVRATAPGGGAPTTRSYHGAP